MRTILIVLGTVLAAWVGQKIYYQPSYIYGEDLPQFEINMIDGSTLTTTSLEGKYVLIDFWGSWCGPCRKESPDLVSLYKTYGPNAPNTVNFEILSIGIESKESRWKSAIDKDQLHWKWHYSSLKRFKDPLAKEFGVREIPTKFLVNPKGMIIAVNPTFPEIRDILDKATS